MALAGHTVWEGTLRQKIKAVPTAKSPLTETPSNLGLPFEHCIDMCRFLTLQSLKMVASCRKTSGLDLKPPLLSPEILRSRGLSTASPLKQVSLISTTSFNLLLTAASNSIFTKKWFQKKQVVSQALGYVSIATLFEFKQLLTVLKYSIALLLMY